MGSTIVHVDAFTDVRFAGNPAAVCLLPGPADERWMQEVARAVNLPATAFVEPRSKGFGVRWFTPIVELALCGHGTLATAHALWEEGRLGSGEPARLHTKAGLLTAERDGAWIDLDFPAEVEEEIAAPPDLARALGASPTYVGMNRLDLLAEMGSEQELRSLAPDRHLLRTIPARGVIVTARSDSDEFDFVSRYFAPRIGIDEDQVTGSAHCCLGPFWGSRLGATAMVGYQASPRGGVVRVRLAGDRVHLGGKAVTVLRGELA